MMRQPMTLKTGKKKESGITLIELLAVILVIGMIVLLGGPLFFKFGSNVRLRSAVDQVATVLRMARDIATTQSITTVATIYTRNTSSPNQIFITSGGNHVEKIWIAPSLTEIPDVSGNTGTQTIQFTSYGTATARSVHIIQKGTLISGSAYNPAGAYSGLSKGERVKCHTVTTDNNTGRSQIYYYGRNSPWASTDL